MPSARLVTDGAMEKIGLQTYITKRRNYNKREDKIYKK